MSDNSTIKQKNELEKKTVLLNQDIGYLLINHLNGLDVISFMEGTNGSEQFSTIEIYQDYIFYRIFMTFFDKEKVKVNIPHIEQNIETWITDAIGYLYHENFYQNDALNLRSFIYPTFTVEAFKSMCCTYKTALFQCYCRLLSFNTYPYVGDLLLIDYFDYKRSIGCPRELNIHERSLFKECSLFQSANHDVLNKNLLFVETIGEFLMNFESRFHSNVWMHAINFNEFHISGGCILNSLCKNPFSDTDMQSIDINFHGNTFEHFDQAVTNVFACLSMMTISNDQNPVIILKKNDNGSYTVTLSCKVQLQFNFKDVPDTNNPVSYILHSSDIDVSQVAFTGSNVVCTFGFLQAISTKSFLCYTMYSNMAKSVCNRIIRYCKRGFAFLESQRFDDTLYTSIMNGDVLEETREETKEIIDDDGEVYTATITYTPRKTPLPNVDPYELQEKFIERITSKKFE